jgi:hypothetical protein
MHLEKRRIRPSHFWRKISGDAPPKAPLRRKDAVACVKSQSDDDLEAIQKLNDANSHFRKILQVTHYRHVLKQAHVDVVKHYVNGELALVFDFRNAAAAPEPAMRIRSIAQAACIIKRFAASARTTPK